MTRAPGESSPNARQLQMKLIKPVTKIHNLIRIERAEGKVFEFESGETGMPMRMSTNLTNPLLSLLMTSSAATFLIVLHMLTKLLYLHVLPHYLH